MGRHEELIPGLGSFDKKGKFHRDGMRKVTTQKSTTQKAKENYPSNKVKKQKKKLKDPPTEPILLNQVKKELKKALRDIRKKK
jgi:hypothetical protein